MITKANERDSTVCCKIDLGTTPEEIWNRPALSAIRYRVGTHSSFKRTMANSIAKDPGLRSWTARSSDDLGIAFIDMWAYLCDILTFYQERIANEHYLRTAILLIGAKAGWPPGLQAPTGGVCLGLSWPSSPEKE
jgi:hypothetical protein